MEANEEEKEAKPIPNVMHAFNQGPAQDQCGIINEPREERKEELREVEREPLPVLQPHRIESSLSNMDNREIPDEFEEGDPNLDEISRAFDPKNKQCHTTSSDARVKVRYIFL